MGMNGQIALVTGVTGTLGDRVALRLRQEGAQVRGLIRKPEQAARLLEMGVEPVLGELNDPTSLAAAVAGASLVVHTAAYLWGDWETARAVNIQGVANLAAAALEDGIKRFVHISTLSVYGTPPAGEIGETYPLCQEPAEGSPYPFTKAESERLLMEAAARGLPVVILRPGAICAERNSHWGDGMVRRMASIERIDRFHPDDLIPWVHTENLVEMVMLASEHPDAVGEAYHAIDGNYSGAEYPARVAAALGKPFVTPDRAPEQTRFRHEKILRLGYRARRSFEEAIRALEQQAHDMRRTGG